MVGWVVFLNVRYRGSVRWTDRNKKGIPTPNTTETNVFARRYRTTHVTDVFYDWNINIENIINPNFLSTENCQSYNLAIPRHSTTKSARTQCRVVVNFNVIRNANQWLVTSRMTTHRYISICPSSVTQSIALFTLQTQWGKRVDRVVGFWLKK